MSRLPSLGPRGEGWVVAQVVLFILIAGSGTAALSDGQGRSLVAFVAGVGAIVAGAGLVVRATRDLRAGLTPFPRPAPGAALVDSGAFRLIRHPIYAGFLLAGLGWSVVAGSIVTLALVGLLALLFDAKARREEAWLTDAVPGYPAYRARTRRFIPGVY